MKNFLVFSSQSLSGGMVYAADLGSVASGVEVRVLSKAFFENTSKNEFALQAFLFLFSKNYSECSAVW
jgi:hypothetical protein